MKVLDLMFMIDLIKKSKVWSLSMEFYGTGQEGPNIGHFYKINGKAQNVHTADLGYLGFQD